MKNIQKCRFIIQFLSLLIAIGGFLVSFKGAMLVILTLTAISGPIFCGWICPYGFIQDISSRVGKISGIKKIKMPRAMQKVLLYFRYIIFALVLAIAADFIFTLMSFDPRVNFVRMLSGKMVGIGAIVVIVLFELTALFFDRPFCNYFCYEGAKYGLIGILRPFTIKRNAAACVNCKKCDKACPMNIQVSKCSNLRSLQCINCLECLSACPSKAALSYGIGMKKYLASVVVAFVLIGSFVLYKDYYANVLTITGNLPQISNAQASTENISQSSDAEEEDVPDSEGKNNTENVATPKEENSKGSTAQNAASPKEENKDNTNNTADSTTTANLGVAKGIADGVYTGQGNGFRGTMTVQIEISNQQIVSIEVLDTNDDAKWFNRANSVIPGRIIEAQSTDVNGVSGATYSSNGIINAVKNALENAR